MTGQIARAAGDLHGRIACSSLAETGRGSFQESRVLASITTSRKSTARYPEAPCLFRLHLRSLPFRLADILESNGCCCRWKVMSARVMSAMQVGSEQDRSIAKLSLVFCTSPQLSSHLPPQTPTCGLVTHALLGVLRASTSQRRQSQDELV